MEKKLKSLLTGLPLLCLLLFFGCKSQPSAEQSPAAFTADFAAAANSGDEKKLTVYEGNTYKLNVKVDGIVSYKYIHVSCTDKANIRVYVPQEELESLSRDDVVALEGTVKEIKVEKYSDMVRVEMTMDPAHIIDHTFEVTGEVKEIFHDWDRDGQDYAAIWDSSVVLDRQINIYLPKDHDVQVGDSLTARGALLAPSHPEEFAIAYIRGLGTPDVFVMPEPDFVQKGVSE